MKRAPTHRSVSDVVRAAREAALLGADSASGHGVDAVKDGVRALRDDAERRFRSLPTVENFHSLARLERQLGLLGEMGRRAPLGLRDAPMGTRHVLRAGESLSQLSARYFGSPAYWDVIYWRNESLIRDPNLLPVGATLVIA
jgi:nucleoid-associated protein YgaU